jgi:hypothetical protein
MYVTYGDSQLCALFASFLAALLTVLVVVVMMRHISCTHTQAHSETK